MGVCKPMEGELVCQTHHLLPRKLLVVRVGTDPNSPRRDIPRMTAQRTGLEHALEHSAGNHIITG